MTTTNQTTQSKAGFKAWETIRSNRRTLTALKGWATRRARAAAFLAWFTIRANRAAAPAFKAWDTRRLNAA
jgi:hypothetical protein